MRINQVLSSSEGALVENYVSAHLIDSLNHPRDIPSREIRKDKKNNDTS